MDTKTFRFSVSSVKEFEQCGLKFKLGRIDKIDKDPQSTHHRWLGSVVHASIYSSIGTMNIAEGFKAWSVTGNIDPSAANYFFESCWEGTGDEYTKSVIELEAGVKPSGRFLRQKKKKSMDLDNQVDLETQWKIESAKMLENGISIVSKLPEIVEIERKIEFEMEGRNFVGFVDLIAKGSDGKYIFLDFKTSWSKPSENDMDEDLQFILYSTALRNILGLDYYPAGYFVHLRSASTVRFDLDSTILKRTKQRLIRDFNRLENDYFTASLGSPLCSYCDFYSHCYGETKKWD